MSFLESLTQARKKLSGERAGWDEFIRSKPVDTARITTDSDRLVLQNIWDTEVQPAFDILKKINVKEMFREIDQEMFKGKGIFQSYPKNIEELVPEIVNNKLMPPNLRFSNSKKKYISDGSMFNETMLSGGAENYENSNEFCKAACSLSAKWIGRVYTSSGYDLETYDSYDYVGVSGSVILVGANKDQIHLYVNSIDPLYGIILRQKLEEFDLNNPKDIKQIRKNLEDTIADKLVHNHSYPFNLISQSVIDDINQGKAFTRSKYDNIYIQIPELVNGDKLQELKIRRPNR